MVFCLYFLDQRHNANDFQLHLKWKVPAGLIGSSQVPGNQGNMIFANGQAGCKRNSQRGSCAKQYKDIRDYPLFLAFPGSGCMEPVPLSFRIMAIKAKQSVLEISLLGPVWLMRTVDENIIFLTDIIYN